MCFFLVYNTLTSAFDAGKSAFKFPGSASASKTFRDVLFNGNHSFPIANSTGDSAVMRIDARTVTKSTYDRRLGYFNLSRASTYLTDGDLRQNPELVFSFAPAKCAGDDFFIHNLSHF
jgi:hypothetical protein